jgi:hypothetical protein
MDGLAHAFSLRGAKGALPSSVKPLEQQTGVGAAEAE